MSDDGTTHYYGDGCDDEHGRPETAAAHEAARQRAMAADREALAARRDQADNRAAVERIDHLPRNARTGEPQNTSLVDDLATVLATVVVGWAVDTGIDLSQHPDVQRVMARYREATRPDRSEASEADSPQPVNVPTTIGFLRRDRATAQGVQRILGLPNGMWEDVQVAFATDGTATATVRLLISRDQAISLAGLLTDIEASDG